MFVFIEQLSLQNNFFRPLDELLTACQEKVQRTTEGGKFRTEELLQMVCELTVHPETYTALAEIFDSFAPVPANYMSDEEIEGQSWSPCIFLPRFVLFNTFACFRVISCVQPQTL